MPRYTPLTPAGDRSGFLARCADYAEQVANVQATVNAPEGIDVSVNLSGDLVAAATEVAAATIDLALAGTKHPVVTSYLLQLRADLGLGI